MDDSILTHAFGMVTQHNGELCLASRNITAVADLCVDLGLVPEDKLRDPRDRDRFLNLLRKALDST